ncbi:V-type ATP synthase subunit I [Halorubrum sp. JWXQ-INN 858]|uniref:V-type ATP synthase subunit I n=1 Tax=Halorubrum sp. JWXQ-INN 858 TaxID=2690782 RepID=UPI001356B569|nr:V-type ATP synthase subunit I [Halorubrum sp. JWXQ-INN 858]MWV65973.1 V-type ATP synthase subunit I [Halorubrum sp. JWXQ-INN 858]
MSKVSVTGSKRVIDEVIEATYDHHSLHVTDYDDRYEGFERGTSLSGAEDVNERLVTVRSLESILDVEGDEIDAAGALDDEDLEARLADVREDVNELNEERDELRAAVRNRQEEIDRMGPFAELGIDLDLLRGYDSLEVVVGEAKPDAVEAALADAETIAAFETFVGGGVVAIVARPAEGAGPGALQDALVGVDVAFLEVPDAEASPSEYVSELERERAELRSELESVDARLAAVKEEAAGFLLRAEEQLTIEAEKKQAPLSFATTENAFVAEGWIPTATFGEFEATIADAVDDHAEVEELERASFTPDGDHHTEPVHGGDSGSDAGREAATDGGHAKRDEPPVVQDNAGAAGPFELLVQGFGRPKYSEFDPTLLVFLTFPLMFGFMIGDLGYGLLYAGIGAFMYRAYDGAMREMGAVAIWAGAFTMLFGIYYGVDVFGYHAYPLLGIESWPISKGLSPGATEWALAWLVASVLFGILHLNVGYVLGFVSQYQQHDLKHAVYEGASWLLLLNGIWVWIFSQHVPGPKPDFIFDSVSVLTLGVVSFAGFPAWMGIAGLVAAVLGVVLIAIGEPAELPEVLAPVVNAVSYARIMAVLLAKGGMALAANLLAFGAYIDQGGEGSFSFIFTPSNLADVQERAAAGEVELVFAGMTTSPDFTAIGIVGGLLVAIVGHIVVLLLGITAAGIQGIRLEYVEFFGKFYQGGGDEYTPFGYDRKYTAEE